MEVERSRFRIAGDLRARSMVEEWTQCVFVLGMERFAETADLPGAFLGAAGAGCSRSGLRLGKLHLRSNVIFILM